MTKTAGGQTKKGIAARSGLSRDVPGGTGFRPRGCGMVVVCLSVHA
ncbi:hypothetical protein BKA14_003185 [Actinoplanes abujensis]|uniref:Uncharacterized protein n=1 Tax=Paractinoplanes abujensis TaxID=882441 RepID=A0A7W7G1T3_9ACTN|nr:hypothetical protein [Actinoplanes abujensis]